jgi:hypothetical protein
MKTPTGIQPASYVANVKQNLLACLFIVEMKSTYAQHALKVRLAKCVASVVMASKQAPSHLYSPTSIGMRAVLFAFSAKNHWLADPSSTMKQVSTVQLAIMKRWVINAMSARNQ